MGAVIDLHEVSEYACQPTEFLLARREHLISIGLPRAAHPIEVELFYRTVMLSEPIPLYDAL